MDLPTHNKGLYELSFRVSIFGAGNVGKTKLVQRLMHNKYTETYVPTIEEYYEAAEECTGITMTLKVIDTSGTEQFPAMRRLNMEKSNLVLLVYDVMNFSSIKEVMRLYEICRNVTVCLIVVGGAKADFLPGKAPVKYMESIDNAISFVFSKSDNRLHHYLCSARTGQNVEKML